MGGAPEGSQCPGLRTGPEVGIRSRCRGRSPRRQCRRGQGLRIAGWGLCPGGPGNAAHGGEGQPEACPQGQARGGGATVIATLPAVALRGLPPAPVSAAPLPLASGWRPVAPVAPVSLRVLAALPVLSPGVRSRSAGRKGRHAEPSPCSPRVSCLECAWHAVGAQ